MFGIGLARGHGWHGYDETQDQRETGGLLPLTYEEDLELSKPPPESESDGAQPMEQDGDEAAPPAIDETPWSFPVHIQNTIMIEEPLTRRLIWPLQQVPGGLLVLPPQILQALPQADPELLQNQCSGAFIRSVLPCPLAYSPLIALLASAAVCGGAAKAGETNPPAPAVPRYTTYLQSAIHLHQLKAAVLECVTPFYETMTPRDLWLADATYKFQLRLLDKKQDDAMDQLYHDNAHLLAHIQLWERNALDYIHYLERFLWETLLAPIPGAPPLEAVLTPTEWPACPSEQLDKEARLFFTFKRELAPANGLADANALMTQGTPYKGWISFEFLSTYAEYLRDSEFAPTANMQ